MDSILGMDEKNGAAAVAVASRQRFTVELRPGETTIVSWKKLIKDAARATSSPTAAVAAAAQPPPPKDVNPMIESRLGPVNGQPAENELKDGHPSRLGSVIEKIERLYMGKHSSDEEDLNDIPDDDEYDTEDSFIDDAELDDYFQVDNSAIKHDGFFVNRGKLERINQPASSPLQQQKKRRRKDLEKNIGDDGELPNKLAKVAPKPKKSRNVGLPHVVALPSVHNEEMKWSNQTNTSAICAKKKSAETKTSFDPSVSSSFSKIDAALSMVGNVDRRVPEMLTSKNQVNKSKDGTVTPNAAVLKPHDKNISGQRKSAPVNLTKGNGVLHVSAQRREKDDNHEKPDLNVSAGKSPMPNTKALAVTRKEGSSVKPKGTILEKTIGELAKMVAESRPPSAEVQDADMTSQAAGKKRLPREVKQKLAKVARLAQANYGRIPDELVNRLMGILGHLIQVRTLKRNLKDMVTMGLTAKKEKDVRVQEMKKDVAELVKMRIPFIKSKILEQQAGGSDDFQEMGDEEKEIMKKKYGMDHTIEDKICDLYDLYVDSLDEEAGTQARKLYAELATLWPVGFMDNHGIKRAICRSKDRKRALPGRSKDQEKIKSKKLVPKSEGTVKVNTSSVAQPQHIQEKSVEKQVNPIGKVPAEALAKKKMKRKPEAELVGGQSRLQKPVSASGDAKVKSHKQAIDPPHKPSLPSVAAHSATTKAVSPPIN